MPLDEACPVAGWRVHGYRNKPTGDFAVGRMA